MRGWLQEARAQLALAVPVTAVQVGLMAMAVVDLIMVGHRSAGDLAAVSVGNAFAFGVMSFGMGALLVLDPLIAQAVGAGDRAAVGRGLQRGVALALLLSVPVALLIAPAHSVFAAVGIDPDVAPVAGGYALTNIPSVFAFYLFVVLRHTLQAMHRLRPIVAVILVGNAANALLNWVLVYGHLGAPELGAVGSGWATSICRWGMALGLLAMAWPVLGGHLRPLRREALRAAPLLKMLGLGLPIGVQLVLEAGGFAAVSLLMGRLGETEAAAHQIAINLASVSFMVPLGISMAAAVRVGREVGAGHPRRARRAARVALVGGAGVMALFGCVFLALPGPLASLYTEDAAVAGLAVVFIRMAAAFQVFDGVQVVSAGVLRGVGDTRFPMVTFLLGFWCLGLPLGGWLTFGTDVGPRGLYLGLGVGLFTAAVVLALRIRVRLSRVLERLDVEAPAGVQ